MADQFNRPNETPTPSAAGTSQPRTVLVERCRVITVHPETFTLDARSELTFRTHLDVSFMSPYCSQENGEGINFMPEVDSVCWVCRPSEQNRYAFVLGWTMVDEGGSYRGGRELLNPGDIQLSTRDGNFVTLRRGGIIQIGATPICQRIYIPIRNIIQDYAENYEMHTPAGDLMWMVLRKEDDGGGHQRCEYSLAVKEYADDPNEKPVAFLKIGSHGEGSDTILTLQTRDKGGGSVQLSLEITKTGEVKWAFKKLTLDIKEEASIQVGSNIDLKALANLMMAVSNSLQISAASISMTAGSGSLALSSGGASLDGGQVNLGTAEFPVLRGSQDIIRWLATVTSLLTGPNAGLPVMTVGPGGLMLPSRFLSPKVKG